MAFFSLVLRMVSFPRTCLEEMLFCYPCFAVGLLFVVKASALFILLLLIFHQLK